MLRNYFYLILLTSLISGCTSNGRENIKSIFQYLTESDNRIIWSNEQVITYDLFEGDDCEGVSNCSPYFGLLCMHTSGENMKFEIYAFFDKSKSCLIPYDNWKSPEIYEQTKIFNNIKFDFYEYGARKFRKFLLTEGSSYTNAEIRKINLRFHSELKEEWKELTSEENFEWSEASLNILRT